MGKGYLFVEGYGDEGAAANLVARLWSDLQLPYMPWDRARRGKNMHQERGIAKVCELARSKADCDALLILRDEDDQCPRERAPVIATWLRQQQLRFPAAIVLAHREFESFFLPCIARMAGRRLVDQRGISRPGLTPQAAFSGDPESVRGVKEWLSEQMVPGRAYKPALDQLPLTRMIDFADIRRYRPALRCFGSLERALTHLDTARRAGRCDVYPPVSA